VSSEQAEMAVPPTLASAPYERARGNGNGKGIKRARTGCKAIDDALCGGIDFGCISCISGEADAGKQSVRVEIAILIHSSLMFVRYL
jgi:RecA/RadA recombinase